MTQVAKLVKQVNRSKNLTADQWRLIAQNSGHLVKQVQANGHTVYVSDNDQSAIVSDGEKPSWVQNTIRKAFIRCGFILVPLAIVAGVLLLR